MKKIFCTVGILTILGLFAGSVMGGDASVELGKKLFEDPALGGSKNDKKCSSCHPGAKGLEEAGLQPNLQEMINFCIERPLKGKKLQNGSVELESLTMYIKSVRE